MASFICHSTSSFELQNLQRALLLCAGREALQGHGQTELDIAAREADAALEVCRPARSIHG